MDYDQGLPHEKMIKLRRYRNRQSFAVSLLLELISRRLKQAAGRNQLASALFAPGFDDHAVFERDCIGLDRVGSVHCHVKDHKGFCGSFSFIVSPAPNLPAILTGGFNFRLAQQIDHKILGFAGLDLGKHIIRDGFSCDVGVRAIGGKTAGQAEAQQTGGEERDYTETMVRFHKTC